MATANSTVFLSANKSGNLNVSFKEKVMERMQWNKEMWIENGEEDSRLNRLVNSLKYWRKKLNAAQGKFSVIFTLFNEESHTFVAMEEVLKTISELRDDIVFTGYSTFRNPRYLRLSFKTEEMKAFVEEKFIVCGNCNVAYLSWAQETSIINIRVHWLPDDLDIKYIKQLLEKYIDIINEDREITAFMDGRKLKSGTVSFRGKMKKDINMKDVPHIAIVEELECLITIQGRQYLCLTCNVLGHRSSECPTPFCHKCKSLKSKKHICSKTSVTSSVSYANKLKGINENGKEWEEEWGRGTILVKAEKLQNRINLVELDHHALEDKGTEDSKQKANSVLHNSNLVKENTIQFNKEVITNKSKVSGENQNLAISTEKKKFIKKNNKIQTKEVSDNSGNSSQADESGEVSDQEDYFENNEAFKQMHNHFAELQKLKIEKIDNPMLSLIKRESSTLQEVDGMEISEFPLKRKLEAEIIEKSEENKILGARRTYGRRRGNAKSQKNLNQSVLNR